MKNHFRFRRKPIFFFQCTIFISHRHSHQWMLNGTTSAIKERSIWQVHCKWAQWDSTSLHLISYLLSSFHTDTHNAESLQQQHRRWRSTAFGKCIASEHSETRLLSILSLTYYHHFTQTLTTLNLNTNNIGAEVAQHLASALQVNTIIPDVSPSQPLRSEAPLIRTQCRSRSPP